MCVDGDDDDDDDDAAAGNWHHVERISSSSVVMMAELGSKALLYVISCTTEQSQKQLSTAVMRLFFERSIPQSLEEGTNALSSRRGGRTRTKPTRFRISFLSFNYNPFSFSKAIHKNTAPLLLLLLLPT